MWTGKGTKSVGGVWPLVSIKHITTAQLFDSVNQARGRAFELQQVSEFGRTLDLNKT